VTFRWQYQGKVEPLWTETTTVDLDWHREPEYPAAHRVPPPREPGMFSMPPLTATTTIDMDWWREPQYPAAYLEPPRVVDQGFQHEPLQAIAGVDPEAGWLIDNQYPAAYLIPPPREQGEFTWQIWHEVDVDFTWHREPQYPAAYLIPPPREPGWYCGQELDEDFFVGVNLGHWWRPAPEMVWAKPNHYWMWPSLFYVADPETWLVVYNRRTMVGHAVLQVASGDTIRVRMKKLKGDGTVGLVEDGSSIKITLHDFS
jgi:hypothetical protein